MVLSCYLNLIEIKKDYIKAQVGKRSYDDIVFVPQTRLVVDRTQFKGGKLPLTLNTEEEGAENIVEVLYLDVLETEVANDNVYHIFSPIHKLHFKDRRQTPRKQCHFISTFDKFGYKFKVVEGTTQGLTLEFSSEKVLSGLVINQEYTLRSQFKTQPLDITVKLKHINYDWYTQVHRIGMSVSPLKAVQENILQHLIDPNYQFVLEQTDTVDMAGGRIRLD